MRRVSSVLVENILLELWNERLKHLGHPPNTEEDGQEALNYRDF
jgi:hypothetical protein